MTAELVGLAPTLVVVVGLVALGWWMDGLPTKREQIRQEQYEADARIQRATFAALHRMYEEARRASSGHWHRP